MSQADNIQPERSVMTLDDFAHHEESIEAAANFDELLLAFKTAYLAAQKMGDQDSMGKFMKLKDEKKKALGGQQ